MNKLALISKMIEVADCLDDNSMVDEATMIDDIIEKTAGSALTPLDPDFVDVLQKVSEEFPDCKTAFSKLDHVFLHQLSAMNLKRWLVNGGETNLVNFVGVYRQHKGDIVATVKDFEAKGIA